MPSEWKRAQVTPIFKKGDKFDASNYRPISLTSAICKVAERIIVNQLLKFLSDNNILPDNQHGFLPDRSVTTNLLSAVNAWTSSLDTNVPTDVIYLDFEKAFDRVPHQRLLSKLEHYGVRGNLLNWIKMYLKNRTFCVRIGNHTSSEHSVISGVPQGSVLGPILFIVYISDLSKCISSPSLMYADDTKKFNNPFTDATTIQDDIDRISAWCENWLLSLNSSKCNILHIGRHNPMLNYVLDGCPLNSVSVQNDLGVLVSNDLKWSLQTVAVSKRANSLIYIIRKAFQNISPSLMLKLYKTYVRPLLEHAISVWNPYFKKDIDLLEKVQRKATKIPFSLKRLSYGDRLSKLHLPTLSLRRSRGDLIETLKILHNYYDCCLTNMFSFNQVTSLRGHNFKLRKSKYSKKCREHFLSNRIVPLWNSLPATCVNAQSVNHFKNKIDQLMFY